MVTVRRSGFTLVELLIVIVIIGLLATIAIPKFSSTKEKAYLSAMKSDLRNLAVMQESYVYENNAYTTSPVNFVTSAGVTGPTIAVTTDGWTGIVGHNITPKTCVIYVGTTALAPATIEGVPTCSP
jgi:prepilin-type N-terminal cleavage/methylation domain-containing protein